MADKYVTEDTFEDTVKRVEKKLDAMYKYLKAVNEQVSDHESDLMKLNDAEEDFWSGLDRERDGAFYELREVFEGREV